MVGRKKKQALNRKKTNLAIAIKKQKRQRKIVKQPEEEQSSVTPVLQEDMAMDEGDSSKKKPNVKDGKRRRNDLPLKSDMEGRPITVKANKFTNVVHRQPISKKKFNKMQKVQRRVQKERERLMNEMQE